MATQQMEVRSLPAEFRDLDTDDSGQMKVSGTLNIPNAQSAPMMGENDQQFVETITPDAFKNAIVSAQRIDLLAMHDPSLLLASTDNDSLNLTQQDDGTINISAVLANTQPAKDTYAMIQDGLMGGLSFGMYVNDCNWDIADDGETPLRIITDLTIFEVSIVRHPAYESTTIETRNISGAKSVKIPKISLIKEEKILTEEKTQKESETRSNDEQPKDETEKKDVESKEGKEISKNEKEVKPSKDDGEKSTTENVDDDKEVDKSDDKSDDKPKDESKDKVDKETDNEKPEEVKEHRDTDTPSTVTAPTNPASQKVASLQDIFNAAYSAISLYNSWSPFMPGDTVQILVNHDNLTNMQGAQGVIEAVNGNAYIVGYQPTDGSAFVDGYRWFTADELQYAFVDVSEVVLDDVDDSSVDDFSDIDPAGEYRDKSISDAKINAQYKNIEKAKIALQKNSNSSLIDYFK